MGSNPILAAGRCAGRSLEPVRPPRRRLPGGGWPSGRRHTPGKRVGGQLPRGFEPLSLRHASCRRWSHRRPSQGHRAPVLGSTMPRSRRGMQTPLATRRHNETRRPSPPTAPRPSSLPCRGWVLQRRVRGSGLAGRGSASPRRRGARPATSVSQTRASMPMALRMARTSRWSSLVGHRRERRRAPRRSTRCPALAEGQRSRSAGRPRARAAASCAAAPRCRRSWSVNADHGVEPRRGSAAGPSGASTWPPISGCAARSSARWFGK